MAATRGVSSNRRRRGALEIRPYQAGDRTDVVRVWKDSGLVVPWNDPLKDISRKQKVQPDLFLVGICDGELVATVMAGYDGHRGWINYLAVHPASRRVGFGRDMMAAADRELRLMGCPKVNLQVRSTNSEVIAFYRKIGFTEDDVVSLGRRLEPDG
jgi:ribosomal protein S18 acetylase RimI-like enzyme